MSNYRTNYRTCYSVFDDEDEKKKESPYWFGPSADPPAAEEAPLPKLWLEPTDWSEVRPGLGGEPVLKARQEKALLEEHTYHLVFRWSRDNDFWLRRRRVGLQAGARQGVGSA